MSGCTWNIDIILLESEMTLSFCSMQNLIGQTAMVQCMAENCSTRAWTIWMDKRDLKYGHSDEDWIAHEDKITHRAHVTAKCKLCSNWPNKRLTSPRRRRKRTVSWRGGTERPELTLSYALQPAMSESSNLSDWKVWNWRWTKLCSPGRPWSSSKNKQNSGMRVNFGCALFKM